ncbi:hypothetical protein [Marinobacterium stanieri]|uniref:AAA domain-containing protein n=1 Tax=Marinobacterium stanieri TaxID=49186 RepID=A0A1N6XCG8_9GAMM|nr:hypothetical protein [Marinobacterium stanieri]SIR00052.1 hypothetical protein SAMN05421647_11383 [Marinobacterium stanieri]
MTKERARHGFELRELRLCGPGQESGSLNFAPGLNVIDGASDTGKSYALSCIDFVMGASTPPEEIPQARKYDVAYLCIQAADGQIYTLKRPLVGGKIGLYHGRIDEALGADDKWEVMGETTNAKESVSGFLLGLCGLDGRRVRKNDRGTTQEVSFRVLSKALLVDEERIIAKRSPLFGSQKTGNTAAASTIRMLLTGVDDSGIVQLEDPKTSAGRLAGRKEAIEGLLERDQAVLDELLENMEVTPEEVSELEAKLRELGELSSTALADLRAAESKRGKLVNEQREQRRRLDELDGMLVRASLLDAHYESDLLRLEAMGESSYLLQMYRDKSCDYCGAEPEHQRDADTHSPESTLQAAQAEAAKVKRLRAELRVASDQLSTEQRVLAASLKEIEAAIQEISEEIEVALAPKVRATANELRTIQGSYGAFVRVEQLRAQIDSLKSQIFDLDTIPDKKEKLEFIKLSANTMSDVCSRIRALLIAWRVADDITVAFDEKSADLVVNGRKRTSHGKGVRAVMCASYVIGLMQEALVANTGHPGFVVLDTPLNPYKEADADDDGEVATSVKDAFYRNLYLSSTIGQVVVFENVAPPADVQASCNHIHFSRNSVGRYGFLPVSARP